MKNKLPELNKERKMSQDKLEELLNVSRQTIISIEKGKYNPSLPLALKIGVIFEAPVEEIFIIE